MPYYHKTAFKQLLDEIPGHCLEQATRKYKGDYRIQHFDTKSHVYALLYCQLNQCQSLRELQCLLESNRKLSHLINVPSVSQFSRKNSSRDYRILEEVFTQLVGRAKRRFGTVNIVKNMPSLKIIGSTMISIATKLAPHLIIDKEHSGVKVSTLFNGEYVEQVNIVHGKTNDRKCIQGMFDDETCIYLFDRGYYHYRWYDQLTERNIRFITLGIKNQSVMKEEFFEADLNRDIYDTKVTLGATASGNLTFNQYREIMTFDEKGEEIVLITNIFDLTKEEVIYLYKKRWEIELFFLWIKQNLKIKVFLGYSENAIKRRIYSALIVFLLIYFFAKAKLIILKMK